MSAKIRDALRASIDQQVADFVDASCAVIQAGVTANDALSQAVNRSALDRIAQLEQKIKELESAFAEKQSVSEDDKYALTKAKLVRLMKDMGYFNG
jgi:DNA-binding transcriptional MerR regulator